MVSSVWFSRLTPNKIRKDTTKAFRENVDLKITVIRNLKIANFSDITFVLCRERYQPYKKPNDTSTYINVSSHHPPNIIKVLTDRISKSMSNISSDKTFDNAGPFYNDALCECVLRKF